MMENDELIAQYLIEGIKYDVWAIRDGENDTHFFDVFSPDSFCINEGNPFWEKPSREDIIDFLAEQA